MSLTATQFRKDLFSVLEQVSKGKPVEIVYKGSKLRLSPVDSGSKLARLKPHDIFLCDPDSIIQTDPELMAEMEAEWEKDWRDL
jgi:prevent-host-death family protein